MIDVIRGKYRIRREIARSNDIVYEAVDTSLDRTIALKELNLSASLQGTARRERIDRFNREARAAGKLNHPNIVAVTDCFEEAGRYFIVMEYLQGQTLRDVLQVRGALPLNEAIDIASQILSALSHAHQHNVVHRDIKPDNIFILSGGHAKLADFGIARLSEEPSLTSDGQVFGTPSYMSPEQIEGRSIDHRSDLFSLGVLLYEMLMGRKPFVGDSVISITYAVMNAEPPPMNGVPMGVEQVVRRALQKHPGGRQSSADQMRQDLRNAETTPAVFLPQALGQPMIGRTGYGQAPPQPLDPYSMPGGSMQTPYGLTPPQMQPSAYNPAPSQPAGLPWAWNTSNTMGSAPQPQSQTYGSAAYPPGPSGIVPYASPPYPVSPPEPIFVLTAAGRTFLVAIFAAAVIGGGIAAGVIALQNGYSHYQLAVGAQHVASLIDTGATAYNAHDYSQAESSFSQALSAGPTTAQRAIIMRNLAYTHVQLARSANAHGNWQSAVEYYRKAADESYDYDDAHRELADILAQHGDARGAADERGSVHSAAAADSTPGRLAPAPPPVAAPTTTDNVDPSKFTIDQQAEARRLISEGKDLQRQGRVDEAREKWRGAIERAPGTNESSEANRLIDESTPGTSDPQ